MSDAGPEHFDNAAMPDSSFTLRSTGPESAADATAVSVCFGHPAQTTGK